MEFISGKQSSQTLEVWRERNKESAFILPIVECTHLLNICCCCYIFHEPKLIYILKKRINKFNFKYCKIHFGLLFPRLIYLVILLIESEIVFCCCCFYYTDTYLVYDQNICSSLFINLYRDRERAIDVLKSFFKTKYNYKSTQLFFIHWQNKIWFHLKVCVCVPKFPSNLF